MYLPTIPSRRSSTTWQCYYLIRTEFNGLTTRIANRTSVANSYASCPSTRKLHEHAGHVCTSQIAIPVTQLNPSTMDPVPATWTANLCANHRTVKDAHSSEANHCSQLL